VDSPIRYSDVELCGPSTVLQLRRLQDAWMANEITEEDLQKRIDALAGE
jgi:hypothetical protein